MPVTPHLLRSRSPLARVALAASLLCWAAGHAAAAGGDLAARVMAARVDAGADPQRALGTLGALRGEALAHGRLDVRLAVDEADCRILSDIDSSRALTVADAGLAAAGAQPQAPARVPWLRLRACRSGILAQLGDSAAARREYDALLALTTPAADAAVRALVLLERGTYRSRVGEWNTAQQDLIWACEQLKRQGPEIDHALCLGHLANFYELVGDLDESLRLQQSLNAAARLRGATFDSSVYSFGIGKSLQAQQHWPEAIRSFEESRQASLSLGDSVGQAYAEQSIAACQLTLGHPRDALDHFNRALEELDPAADPRQHEIILLTRAQALSVLGRAAEANAELERVEPAVRTRGEQPSLALWLNVRASVMRQLGRWHEAYVALADARGVEDKLQEQRASQQTARLRMQFNRVRDEEDIDKLRQINDQGQRLRQTQATALALAAILLLAVLAVATRKYRQARNLKALAESDELTGLANRRALLAFADDALAKAQRQHAALAVLMIDLDHFKRVNDSHGHSVGDQVLRQASRVLAASLREHDLLGRVGGEEFVAVLPGATLGQAQQVAERMRGTIDAAHLSVPSGEVRFTVSIGVAGALHAESAAALLARADRALYRAKHAGRNTVVVDEVNASPAEGPADDRRGPPPGRAMDPAGEPVAS